MGIVVIDDHGVKLLLPQTADAIGIAATLHPEAEAGQHRREYGHRLLVFGNQKRREIHTAIMSPQIEFRITASAQRELRAWPPPGLKKAIRPWGPCYAYDRQSSRRTGSGPR